MKIRNLLLFTIIFFVTFSCSSESSTAETCVQKQWFRDVDGDGFGDPLNTITSCLQPEGFVAIREPEEAQPAVVDQNFNVTPGEQKVFLLNETKANYGFALYTPTEYNDDKEQKLPLLIYLHGGGGRGPGNSLNSFDRVIFGVTPPSLIQQGVWNPPAPMVVVSPQSSGIWNAERLHNFIAFLIKNMNIDASRIYMTGLSMGGRGTFDYVTQYGAQAYTAAVVPIAGWSLVNEGAPFKTVPLWAFHGDADDVINVNGSKNMVNAINNSNPEVRAKLTIFPGVNHFSWQKVYDSSGIGTEHSNYDVYNTTIYDWMLQFTKDSKLVK